jgi:tRNA (guanine37-N1)-methyltransferase
MKYGVITIFPEIFHAYLNEGILKRAVQKNLIEVHIHNLRDFSKDKHRTVDDYPYGGGSGMVMKPEPFFDAVETLYPDTSERRVILLNPASKQFNHDLATELSHENRQLVFLCGRYEAIDERVKIGIVDDEISIGDYILTGGELPALVIIDAVTRLIPGVLGNDESAEAESFSRGILDYPHYTRPSVFRDMAVPEILLSGNHKDIMRWRKKEALRRTLERRPDLIETAHLSSDDYTLLNEIKEEQ